MSGQESKNGGEVFTYTPEKERELISRTEQLILDMKEERKHNLVRGIGTWAGVIFLFALVKAIGVRGEDLNNAANAAMAIAGAVGMFLIVKPWWLANTAIRTTKNGLEEFKAHRYKGDYENNFVGQAEAFMNSDRPFLR
ncbi:MAG: hypothetical protein IKE30_05680 [Clostridia bacterium]|nr:hypothetical protein [Clostridia bacterium]